MDFSYKFPAVKGRQAGKDYYITMIPLKHLIRILPEPTEYIPPEYRAQRRLNETRIPEIKNYIIDNRNSYVFSSLTASIDGDFIFHADDGNESLGILEISMDSKILINDGQHRRAAITQALIDDETLGDETISVVFFADKGLKNSQQMFTDLNKHAVKTSNSISELYDSRDEVAIATREVVDSIPFLSSYTDKEKDNLGKYSSNLFTLNMFYAANKRIVKNIKKRSDYEKVLKAYWTLIAENITEWNEVQNKTLSKVDVRENYVITQAVIIKAFGIVGEYYVKHRDVINEKNFQKLRTVNWKRSNSELMGRIVNEKGRIINGEGAIILAANYIKKELGFELDDLEIEREKMMK